MDQRLSGSASAAASPGARRTTAPQAASYIYGQITAQNGSTWTVQGIRGNTYIVLITPRTAFGTLFHRIPSERFTVGHTVRVAGDFDETAITATAVSFTKRRASTHPTC